MMQQQEHARESRLEQSADRTESHVEPDAKWNHKRENTCAVCVVATCFTISAGLQQLPRARGPMYKSGRQLAPTAEADAT